MVTGAIRTQRCFTHPDREAVARCPGCGRFFCRECVTEHEDRLLCAACLKTATIHHEISRGAWRSLMQTAEFLFAILLCWLFFYYLGRLLIWLPGGFAGEQIFGG